MKNILSVGITGGIGSGKSTVARIFEALGYAVYYADERAKILMVEDQEIIQGLNRLFGAQAYLADGQLNRQYIGGLVFKDPKLLAQLNAIVHPRTGADYLRWSQQQQETGYAKSFLLKEAAILYESGAYRATNRVIDVYAPKRMRIERVMRRDQVAASAVIERMQRQWSEAEKIRRSDFTIYNDGRHSLNLQVRAVIQAIG